MPGHPIQLLRIADLRSLPRLVILTSLLIPAILQSVAARAADLAYVALQNAGQVAIVDVRTGAILRQIPVGQLPRGAVASRDGRSVFVLNQGDKTVSVVDVASHLVRHTLDIAPYLDASQDAGESLSRTNIAVSPDGAHLYLLNQVGRLVRLPTTAGAGAAPVERALSGYLTNPSIEVIADGARLLIPGRNELVVIDAATLRQIGQLPLSATLVNGMAAFRATRSGPVVVGDDGMVTFGMANLDLFASETASIYQLVSEPGTRTPEAALSRDGRYYFRARQNGGIYRFDSQTRQLTAGIATGATISGLALTADDSLLVALNPTQNAMRVIDAKTMKLVKSIPLGPTPRAHRDFIITSTPQAPFAPQPKLKF
ncbi:hypothetical protein [Bosea sp. BK604]|uniref:hypothetical protein n=1 Tax=Bosea sp. BK604 TaxID=2512180 RepID=UPI001053DE52|nr:hypothetical protein [Bosea sp. BK604]TCR67376.1 DNA-binding beta-propeller fold protein YncE [Bosea sp. BK604]